MPTLLMGFGVIAVRPNSFGQRVHTSGPICVVTFDTSCSELFICEKLERGTEDARSASGGVDVSERNELEIQTETLTKIHTIAMKRNESGRAIFVNLRI